MNSSSYGTERPVRAFSNGAFELMSLKSSRATTALFTMVDRLASSTVLSPRGTSASQPWTCSPGYYRTPYLKASLTRRQHLLPLADDCVRDHAVCLAVGIG